MNLKSNLVAVAAVSAIGGAAFLGANTVSAQTSGESLVQRIAERFELDEAEVESFFYELKEERMELKDEMREQHLDGLVDDGIITEDQKNLLIEKFEENRAERQTLKEENSDLSKAEIKQLMEDRKAEMEAWAEENGINLEEIRPDKKEGFRKHGRGIFPGASES